MGRVAEALPKLSGTVKVPEGARTSRRSNVSSKYGLGICLGTCHFSGRGYLVLLGAEESDQGPASLIQKLGGRACRIKIPLVLARVKG